ncbi:hypothetical protein TYRP_007121 [Tyrophagus putrescentiae]|nr:hypothetical protein TYRP_007121 [Tyrophagus putrescentiae]
MSKQCVFFRVNTTLVIGRSGNTLTSSHLCSFKFSARVHKLHLTFDTYAHPQQLITLSGTS